MTDVAKKATGKTAAGTTGLGGRAVDVLTTELTNLAGALGERVVGTITDRAGNLTGRLTEAAANGGSPQQLAAAVGMKKLADGGSPLKAALHAGLAGGKEKLKQAVGKGGKGGGKIKVTNIVESIEVGVPVRVAYDQWTQFADFPSFMKKVENIDQQSDEKMTWKAQVFWSHRTWEATIREQVPDKHIIWKSKGEKGSVDGTVSFHELTPDLTRILVVLEYHPQGLFEKTGNLWRAQGRRVRLELKHFVRHVMTKTILGQDELQGWRGEIRDGQVVRDHETALREESQRGEEPERERRSSGGAARRRPSASEQEERPTPRRKPQRRQPAEETADVDQYDEDEDWTEEAEPEQRPAPRARGGRTAARPVRRTRSASE